MGAVKGTTPQPKVTIYKSCCGFGGRKEKISRSTAKLKKRKGLNDVESLDWLSSCINIYLFVCFLSAARPFDAIGNFRKVPLTLVYTFGFSLSFPRVQMDRLWLQ